FKTTANRPNALALFSNRAPSGGPSSEPFVENVTLLGSSRRCVAFEHLDGQKVARLVVSTITPRLSSSLSVTAPSGSVTVRGISAPLGTQPAQLGVHLQQR